MKSLLCTDTATNYKKFVKMKGLQHEVVNERQKQRVNITTVEMLRRA
jgi:hypothetical protein